MPRSLRGASSPFVPALLLLAACSSEVEAPPTEEMPQVLSSGLSPRTPQGISSDPLKALNTAILHPGYVSTQEAGGVLRDDDEVFLFRARDAVHAYPVAVLGLHHVINDTIAGEPVAITHCTLSDSALVYSRRIEGQTLSFDALTSFYLGNMAMFDGQTSSYWTQLSGEAVTGSLKGKRLEVVGTLERTRWSQVKHLAGLKVMALPRDLREHRRFREDMRSSRLGVEVLSRIQSPDGRLPAYTPGLGIVVREEARFYPLESIVKKGILNDEVGGWALLIVQDLRFGSAKVFRRWCEGRRLRFERRGDALVDRETESTWDLDGECIAGTLRGRTLPRPVFTQVFWFAWAAFYPRTSVQAEPHP